MFVHSKALSVGAGWAGTQGHIDPEAGVAVIFATQAIPSLDSQGFNVYGEYERILYSNL